MKRATLKQIIVATKLRHLGMSNKKISEQLGIELKTVEDAFTQAPQFVELKFNILNDKKYEIALMEKFGLMDAVVVETGDEETALSIVAQAAADYFINNILNNEKVVISCGEPLLQMILAIPTQTDLKLYLHQMSIEADPSTVHQAPATLLGLFRSKISKESSIFGIQLPPPRIVNSCSNFRKELISSELIKDMHKNALDADVFILGIGTPIAERGNSVHSFIQMAEAAVGRSFSHYVKEYHLVGEINNQVYDAKGIDRTNEIPEFTDYVINILKLDEIKKLASDRANKKVIAIATGERKHRAIKVAIQNGFVNILITGRDDAVRLLEDK